MFDPSREARRWILQALDDLKFVRWIRDEAVFFDKGCFQAQQAGEKALKACLYGLGRRRVIGHSLLELVQELAADTPPFAAVLDAARRLDRFYIATRYPNGLPGGCPYQAYTHEDLVGAAQDVEVVVHTAAHLLRERGIVADIPPLPRPD